MKGTTLKRWIVVGFVVAGIVAIIASILQPTSPAFLSLRVVQFAHGDTNALVEIKNHIGAPLTYHLVSSEAETKTGKIGRYQSQVVSFPARSIFRRGDVYCSAARFGADSRSWWSRYIQGLQKFGVDLHFASHLEFGVTDTGWLHATNLLNTRR